MGVLNAKQFKKALLAVGLLMVINLSFPPFVERTDYRSIKKVEDKGYDFIMAPMGEAEINFPKLGLQSVIILVIGCGVFFGLRPTKANDSEDVQ